MFRTIKIWRWLYIIKGKEFYKNRKLEYEGEYLYDRKWNGKGYDENGNVVCELINGKGNVKEFGNFSELLYEGDFVNGKRDGKGKHYLFS